MRIPGTTILRRREPKRDRSYTPQKSVRRPVAINPSLVEAPEPVDYSKYWNIGKDPRHAFAHVWQYQSLAINERLAVAGWPFAVPKVPSALVVGMPQGVHNSAAPPVNIVGNRPTSYGSLAALNAPIISSPMYAKLG